MSDEPITTEEKFRQAREELHQEWVHLQIVGRALTPEEQRRSDALSRAVQLIDEALAALSCEVSDDINLSEGAYIAMNDQVNADLRIDITDRGL